MAKQTSRKPNSNATIVLTVADVKRIAKSIGLPAATLFSVIFDNDSELGLKSGGGGHHPKLLSVVPSNIERIMGYKKTKK
jgi:hypothetical protein